MTMTAHNHRKRHQRRQRRGGFTLLEVIVVVTIIALLAALVAPRLLGQIGKSKQKIAASEVSSIAQQVQLWMVDNGYSTLPDDFELRLLVEGNDPYLNNEDDLLDPWDRPYLIIIPGEENPDFDIITYGADGEPGGEGENADVVN